MKLEVGDIVYIKSEEKLDSSKRNYMTVCGFYKYEFHTALDFNVIGVWGEGELAVTCVWFKENKEQIKRFNKNLLVKLS